MTTGFSGTGPQPVTSAITAASKQLTDIADLGLFSLSPEETETNLTALAALRHQVHELELRHLRQAERLDVGPERGATDTAVWWADRTQQLKRTAHHRSALADALDHHEPVREAMAHGRISEEQAVVIVRGVEELPAEHRAEAEVHLVELAEQHDPLALKRLADHVLEVVAPGIAEAHERAALERQDALAEEACRFTMRDHADGTTRLSGRIPTPVAAMLRQALLAHNAPKHRRHSGTPKGHGHAFCEYVTRYPVSRLPKSGGVAARIVVQMTLDQLQGRLDASGIATLNTGEKISIGQARKLACEAQIIPMVLDGKSVPLDLGLGARLYTEHQRIAMGIRDKGCTAEGCDWPPALCHAHHNTPWSKGGKTNIHDGRLLCPRHHAYAHSPKYEMKTIPNGRVVFSRS